MMQMYDVVRLTSKLDTPLIPVGATGTILMIFEGTPTAYMIEFTDEAGESLGAFVVPEGSLEVVKNRFLLRFWNDENSIRAHIAPSAPTGWTP